MESAPVVEMLSKTSLFADLPRPQLEAVVHEYEEEAFAQGQRIVRQGMSGSGVYVILDGEATVVRAEHEIARLGRGDFFGEGSILTGENPSADVVATTFVRCLVIPAPSFERFLLDHPQVMLRMLRAVSLRLRGLLEWRA